MSKRFFLLLVGLMLGLVTGLPAMAQSEICVELAGDDTIEVSPDASADDLTLKLLGRGVLRSFVAEEYDFALNMTDEMIKTNEDYANTYLYRGCIEQALGQDDAASEDYQKFIELSDDADLVERLQALLETPEKGNFTSQKPANLTGVLPAAIASFEGSWQEITDELSLENAIPFGVKPIFADRSSSISGEGNTFNDIAANVNEQDFIMGSTLKMESDSTDFEFCWVMARLQIELTEDGTQERAAGFLAIGLLNDGELYVTDYFDNNPQLESYPLRWQDGESVQIVAHAVGTKLNVYANGERVIRDYEVTEASGAFAFGLASSSASTRCRVTNYWAARIPQVNGDDCEIHAVNAANKRQGPGTNFERAGQLAAGTTQLATGRTEAEDGFMWWQLEDESWVRQDVVDAVGYCGLLPEVNVQ